MTQRPFDFVEINALPPKPREYGLTEVRGPLYTQLGPGQLTDMLRMAGEYVDTLKFAGGAMRLLPREVLVEMIDICHQHDVEVSTGGFIEHVLGRRGGLVSRYIEECKSLGFDIVEISANYISIPRRDLMRLCRQVVDTGMKVKPEIGVQFGTGGGAMSNDRLAEIPVGDVDWMLRTGELYLDAGASMLMIESEGLTEGVDTWRVDVIAKVIDRLGLETVMFEAADPAVYTWYLREYGTDVNVFIDHSQVMHFAAFRAGIGGGRDLWGRVLTVDSAPN